MKFKTVMALFLLMLVGTTSVGAQQVTPQLENTEQIRTNLLEVEAKQAELRIWLQQLDEDLKPENIERSLAGVGSTRPEELRAQRRRVLTIERDGVVAQLKVLEANHSRLEAALRDAETQAYLRQIQPPSPAANTLTLTGIVPALYGLAAKSSALIITSGLVIISLLGIAIVVMRRKRD